MVRSHAASSPTTAERVEAPPAERAQVALRLVIVEPPERWRLEEDDVPETPLHDAIIQTLLLVLKQWAQQGGHSALVTSNLACRWDPSDARIGTDPDVVLVEPAPTEGEHLTSLRVWEPGHAAPRIAVEVVSETTANKDYLDVPTRCARLGVRELWVFDPLLAGPSDAGGPYLLQVWRNAGNQPGALDRVHAGVAPARSEELGAYLVVTDDGTRLRLANDPAGETLWPTAEEAALAQADAERARADEERARAARRARTGAGAGGRARAIAAAPSGQALIRPREGQTAHDRRTDRRRRTRACRCSQASLGLLRGRKRPCLGT